MLTKHVNLVVNDKQTVFFVPNPKQEFLININFHVDFVLTEIFEVFT